MHPSYIAKDLADFELDVLGQSPRINRLYTQITFCFPLPDDSHHLQCNVINSLTQALRQLSLSFPWTAGKVVNEHGRFKIKALEDIPRLITKTLSNVSWDALRRARFPFSMLDESVVAPCKTLAVPD
jgi:hypothetical protein